MTIEVGRIYRTRGIRLGIVVEWACRDDDVWFARGVRGSKTGAWSATEFDASEYEPLEPTDRVARLPAR